MTIPIPDVKNVWILNESGFLIVGFRIPTVLETFSILINFSGTVSYHSLCNRISVWQQCSKHVFESVSLRFWQSSGRFSRVGIWQRCTWTFVVAFSVVEIFFAEKKPRKGCRKSWLFFMTIWSPNKINNLKLSRHSSMVSTAVYCCVGPGFKSKHWRELLILIKRC